MAYDDMMVMIYRVLRYLDACLKAGKTPTKEDILRDCQLYKLPEEYRDNLLKEISDQGLVHGITVIESKDGDIVFVQDDVRITMCGEQYLSENSAMQKARELLGKAFEITVQAAVKALLP